MWAAVHPDRTRWRHPGYRGVPRSNFVGLWVNVFPNAQIREVRTVIGRMWNTLMFRHSPEGRRPCLGSKSIGIIYGDALILADFRPPSPLQRIFVLPCLP